MTRSFGGQEAMAGRQHVHQSSVGVTVEESLFLYSFWVLKTNQTHPVLYTAPPRLCVRTKTFEVD
jgi:hypothetical protein